MTENYILEHISELAAKEGWSNYELAKHAGIPQSTIVNLFSRTNVPTLPTLIKICSAFGITVSQFFSEPGNYPDLTSEQTDILILYDTLTEHHKTLAKDILTLLSQRQDYYDGFHNKMGLS